MDHDAIAALAASHHLAIMGGFHPAAGEGPQGAGTVLLLGPAEPGFWPHVTAEPEFLDGAPDPLDRWSLRVIGALAGALDAQAAFPFGGPPFHPFFRWAIASGRAFPSPVQLLVHDAAGLFVSYRGALILRQRIALPDPPASSPCETCPRPCIAACPVGALTGQGYDLDRCHDWLSGPNDCMTRGCAVRRACPLSQRHGRLEVQSAHHMSYFHR
ncbi:ferredoxin [Halodurantibacterium flavum]|uniref:Ferredoxin n=1 Tax=Halodurantibacterium flavum TaxID=1382802 RepID=A0ABW4S6S6_9RHOB